MKIIKARIVLYNRFKPGTRTPWSRVPPKSEIMGAEGCPEAELA
jgi:hypothetical protein